MIGAQDSLVEPGRQAAAASYMTRAGRILPTGSERIDLQRARRELPASPASEAFGCLWKYAQWKILFAPAIQLC